MAHIEDHPHISMQLGDGTIIPVNDCAITGYEYRQDISPEMKRKMAVYDRDFSFETTFFPNESARLAFLDSDNCAVSALAAYTGLEYEHAFKLLEKAGRKINTPTELSIFYAVLRLFGMESVYVGHMTVFEFLQKYRGASFIGQVQEHVFTVRFGKVVAGDIEGLSADVLQCVHYNPSHCDAPQFTLESVREHFDMMLLR